MNDKFTGLLGDPMLQIGLGILANNTGNRGAFAPAFGRGVMQGLSNAQDFQAQQQFMNARNMQASAMMQRAELQRQEMEREQQQRELQEKAIQEATAKNPELAGLFRLDPKSAIKQLYPQAGGEVDNVYFPTPKGLFRANKKNSSDYGYIDMGGAPVIRSQDDPSTRGAVKTAEGYGSTFGSNMADAGLPMPTFNLPTPKPTQAPAGFPSVSPNVQAQRDDKRMQILLAEQQAVGGAGKNPELDKEINNMKMRGYSAKIPTKAELDAASAQAKANVELNMKPQIEAATLTAKAQGEAALDLPKVINQGEQTIKLVDDLVNSKGFETAVGLSSKLDPRNYLAGTDATDFKIRLDQLKGQQFLQAFESLKGGGQITEVEGKKATDAISRMNTAQSEEEFKAAANEFKGVIKQGVDRAKQKAGGAPARGQVFNELPPPNKYKGKIIRNPDTGERMQSDGMRWKAL